jgi:hypothetical protein
MSAVRYINKLNHMSVETKYDKDKQTLMSCNIDLLAYSAVNAIWESCKKSARTQEISFEM